MGKLTEVAADTQRFRSLADVARNAPDEYAARYCVLLCHDEESTRDGMPAGEERCGSWYDPDYPESSEPTPAEMEALGEYVGTFFGGNPDGEHAPPF